MTTEKINSALIAEAISRATANNTMLTYSEAKALLKAMNLNLKTPQEYKTWWANTLFKDILPENPEEYYK